MTSPSMYQQVVREIYEAIADVDTVKTLQEKYHAVIDGRTTTHEVDVYWEFTDGDITYKAVIQAEERTTLEELFKFLRIVRDIPGQVMGIIVTSPVYQRDIKEMAANAGILLCELAAPAAVEVWEPVVSNIRVNVDKAWVKEAKEKAGLGNEPVAVSSDPRYSFIYDESGNCVTTVQRIFDQYGKQLQASAGGPQTMVHTFNGSAFLQTNHELVPLIRLDNITFDVELANMNQIHSKEMLADILDSILHYFRR